MAHSISPCRVEPTPIGLAAVSDRRVNQGLLVLLVAAVVTGWLAFAIGTSVGLVVVAAHGIAGLGIVVLAPWKSAMVSRGLAHRRSGRLVSVALIGLVSIAIVTGVLMATVGLRRIGFLTAMQVHVGSAMLALVVGVVHTAQRGAGGRPTDFARRDLLRTGGVAALSVAAWVAVEGAIRVAGLAGSDRRFTGSHERGSGDPAAMPTVQWIDDPVPDLDGASWEMRVVDAKGERILRLGDLDGADEMTAVLDCTGGWWARQRWTGVRLDRLIDGAGLESLVAVSATGYRRRFPLRDASGMLLATGIDGEPLSAGHGFPARIVAPSRRGFWWVKWVIELRADRRPWWWQSPFPLT